LTRAVSFLFSPSSDGLFPFHHPSPTIMLTKIAVLSLLASLGGSAVAAPLDMRPSLMVCVLAIHEYI
jgi:hypothetical protein